MRWSWSCDASASNNDEKNEKVNGEQHATQQHKNSIYLSPTFNNNDGGNETIHRIDG